MKFLYVSWAERGSLGLKLLHNWMVGWLFRPGGGGAWEVKEEKWRERGRMVGRNRDRNMDTCW